MLNRRQIDGNDATSFETRTFTSDVADKRVFPRVQQEYIESATWQCPQCTFVNQKSKRKCAMCRAANPRCVRAVQQAEPSIVAADADSARTGRGKPLPRPRRKHAPCFLQAARTLKVTQMMRARRHADVALGVGVGMGAGATTTQQTPQSSTKARGHGKLKLNRSRGSRALAENHRRSLHRCRRPRPARHPACLSSASSINSAAARASCEHASPSQHQQGRRACGWSLQEAQTFAEQRGRRRRC